MTPPDAGEGRWAENASGSRGDPPDGYPFTVIVTFTVAPERQRALAEWIAGGIAGLSGRQPGFVAARVHASVDGTRVVNVAQWRSRADYEAFTRLAAAREGAPQLQEFGRPDVRLYDVTFAQDGPSP